MNTRKKKAPTDLRQMLHLAMGAHQRGDLAAAESGYRAILALQPRSGDALNLLGAALLQQGRLPEALSCARAAAEVLPQVADVWSNLAIAALRTMHFGEAAAAVDRALTLQPGHLQAALIGAELAAALANSGRLIEARAAYQAALPLARTDQQRHRALLGLGNLSLELGRHAEALAHLRAARSMAPADPSTAAAFFCALLSSHQATPQEVFAEHRHWGRLFAPAPFPPAAARRPGGTRIGVLSRDLRDHAVCRFLLSWLPHRSRADQLWYAYADGPVEDAASAALRPCFDVWRTVSAQSDEALYDQLASDDLDILIDLNGHTLPNRLGVLARRPARRQVNWLGYPGTTGLEQIDDRLVDDVTDPDGAESLAVERLVRLPGCFLCYAPFGEERSVPVRTESQSAADRPFTFGCFNNLHKLNDVVIETFAAILDRAPGSRLIVKNFPLTDPAVQTDLRSRFAAVGVDPARLELRSATGGKAEHLASYDEVDLALDSFPYNGTTTTCEALWMGVPVLTLLGDAHPGRVSASLIGTALGPDGDHWIASSRDDYISRAAAVAQQSRRSESERRALRARVASSPLMDGQRFAAVIEQLMEDLRAETANTP